MFFLDGGSGLFYQVASFLLNFMVCDFTEACCFARYLRRVLHWGLIQVAQ